MGTEGDDLGSEGNDLGSESNGLGTGHDDFNTEEDMDFEVVGVFEHIVSNQAQPFKD